MHDEISEKKKGNRFLKEAMVIAEGLAVSKFPSKILKMVTYIGKYFCK